MNDTDSGKDAPSAKDPRSPKGTGSNHSVWKFLAWLVATAIALGGTVLGVLQYRSSQETQREQAAQASRSAEQERQEEARRRVGEVCAQALDVFDSIISLSRSANAGTAPEELDLVELRSQLRGLTEAANRANDPELSRAASSVRSRFDLLSPGAEVPPEVRQQIVAGVFDYVVIIMRCYREGFPIPSVPPDLVPTTAPEGTNSAGPASLGVITEAPESGEPGARIIEVKPGSPAERAGLRAGDVVLGVADVVITAPNDLQQAISRHRVGEVVFVAYLRGDVFSTVQVTL